MVTPIPDNAPARLNAVAEYWRGKRRTDGQSPFLADIDLMDIYLHAPFIFIADRVPCGNDAYEYVWRYWGTALRNLTGIEATGKPMRETHDEDAFREAEASYDSVMESGEPDYWVRQVRTVAVDRSFMSYERVVFPFRSSTGESAHVLGVAAWLKTDHPAIRSGEQLVIGKIGVKPPR
jgi:hypothetical protein